MNAAQEWQGQPEGGAGGGSYAGGWQPGAAPQGAGMGPPPGGRPYPQADPRRKSPVLAAVLSGIMPGLGQIYLGFYTRGFTHAFIFIALITALSSGDLHGLEPLFGISLGFFYLYNVVDGARRAALYNQVLMGVPEGTLPEDFTLKGSGGSMVGGVLLVALGVILLLNTKFDIDLEWLEEWWPAGLIVLGLWLAYKSRQERAKS